MGRKSLCLSAEEKKSRALEYSKKYREKVYNIKNNITFRCDVCDKDIVINPLKEHSHWEIKYEPKIITYD
tara:strand:- start:539 stop:748 length:210 start_codon:yes stop_codon:yes gene_type:complete